MPSSYSQFGEDIIVGHFIKNVVGKTTPGFYIDVGAFHPICYSNTALLYEAGWRGINIDADPGAIALFDAERPRDINICKAVSDTAAIREFYVFAGGAASTCDPAVRDTWLGLGWRQIETRHVETQPLRDILEPHLFDRHAIDYLNIDIEGLDSEALATFDFGRWKPSVLTIEIHGLDLTRAEQNDIVRFLTAFGYRLVSYAVVTAVFLRI